MGVVLKGLRPVFHSCRIRCRQVTDAIRARRFLSGVVSQADHPYRILLAVSLGARPVSGAAFAFALCPGTPDILRFRMNLFLFKYQSGDARSQAPVCKITRPYVPTRESARPCERSPSGFSALHDHRHDRGEEINVEAFGLRRYHAPYLFPILVGKIHRGRKAPREEG